MDKNEKSWNTKCAEENCVGDVDFNNYTTVQTGCHAWSTAYACNGCGRLHFKDESNLIFTGVISRQDKKAFLVANGQIDLRD